MMISRRNFLAVAGGPPPAAALVNAPPANITAVMQSLH